MICESLKNFAPAKCTWWGPIAALQTDLSLNTGGTYYEGIGENEFTQTSNKLFYFFDDPKTYFGFVFYIIYSFIPIFLFFLLNKFIEKKLLIVLFLCGFLFSLPLFHVAQDWSRWFSVHFHLIAFMLFFLQQITFIQIKKANLLNEVNNFFLKRFKYMFILLIFVYSTAFHHHHFFHKGVRLELTYIKVLNKIIK